MPRGKISWMRLLGKKMDFTPGMQGIMAMTLAKQDKTNICEKESTVILGGVKSPMITTIAKREKEIANFTPHNFITFSFNAKANGKECRIEVALPKDDPLLDKYGYLTSKESIKELENSINGKTFKGKVEEKQVEIDPPMPFDLNSLTKQAEQVLGFSPDETMEIS